MTTQKSKVLFLSTGDATRSLIAEGFLRSLTGDQFDVASAGVKPGVLNPLATQRANLELDNANDAEQKSVEQHFDAEAIDVEQARPNG